MGLLGNLIWQTCNVYSYYPRSKFYLFILSSILNICWFHLSLATLRLILRFRMSLVPYLKMLGRIEPILHVSSDELIVLTQDRINPSGSWMGSWYCWIPESDPDATLLQLIFLELNVLAKLLIDCLCYCKQTPKLSPFCHNFGTTVAIWQWADIHEVKWQCGNLQRTSFSESFTWLGYTNC